MKSQRKKHAAEKLMAGKFQLTWRHSRKKELKVRRCSFDHLGRGRKDYGKESLGYPLVKHSSSATGKLIQEKYKGIRKNFESFVPEVEARIQN